MNTQRYITYIIQKALQLHGLDEKRGLGLYYQEKPQRLREVDAVDTLGKFWSKPLRFTLPSPQAIMDYATHLGIFHTFNEANQELLLFSKEGNVYHTLFNILNTDEQRGLQESMQSIFEDHLRYGDAGFISLNQDPDT